MTYVGQQILFTLWAQMMKGETANRHIEMALRLFFDGPGEVAQNGLVVVFAPRRVGAVLMQDHLGNGCDRLNSKRNLGKTAK